MELYRLQKEKKGGILRRKKKVCSDGTTTKRRASSADGHRATDTEARGEMCESAARSGCWRRLHARIAGGRVKPGSSGSHGATLQPARAGGPGDRCWTQSLADLHYRTTSAHPGRDVTPTGSRTGSGGNVVADATLLRSACDRSAACLYGNDLDGAA